MKKTNLDSLTSREKEVMLLCSQGFTNKNIADQFGISIRTVEAHKTNIFRKLGINSTVEMICIAHQNKKYFK